MTAEHIFGILYSWAGQNVAGCGDDLISNERFSTRVEAETEASSRRRATGAESEVMIETPDGWRSMWGETTDEVINRRWVVHPKHKCEYVERQRVMRSKLFPSSNIVWMCQTCGKRRYQAAS
ncbi:hypothetical protein SEA_DALANDE_71 [Gordonia phage DalanDe]|nr:hypothetical protein SEA_DALANDE_71 [Gordonia phage DalanDe]